MYVQGGVTSIDVNVIGLNQYLRFYLLMFDSGFYLIMVGGNDQSKLNLLIIIDSVFIKCLIV